MTDDGTGGSGYVLYDRVSGRYVASGGAFTTDAAAALVVDQAFVAIRLLTRHSCEPLSLIAVRAASPLVAPVARPLAAAG